MFISDAFAQTAGTAPAAADPMQGMIGSFLPLILMGAVFYFLIFRPQMQQRKRMQEMLAAIKKNDVIVTQGGLIGKVRSVQDDEVRVELAPNVEVRLVRAAVAEVRSKTDPAPANDTKPASAS
ncbi:MAG: preprotein translocase subunit YajC [Proteobacteria bacterium]|nr:preprotein translocase subunit YajC [Pseudomonadota bacterium]